MAKRPAKKKKDVKEHSPGIQKRMQNLCQFSGKKSGPKAKEDVVLEETPTPLEIVKKEVEVEGEIVEVPTATAEITIPITTKAVLGKEELKIYVTEVSEWAEEHPEWNIKEDREDIHLIAMEKVIQFRLLLKKKNSPRVDIEKDYSSSSYRVQTARQNLAARRADRVSGKGNITNVTNIAILASEFDSNKLEEMKKRIEDKRKEEVDMFEVIEN